jgi:tetratricopeptide (TPR) repeat protein
LLGAEDVRSLPLLPDLGAALVEIGEFARAKEVLDAAVTGSKAAGEGAVEYNARLELIRLNLLNLAAGTLTEARRATQEVVAACEEGCDDVVLAKAWNLAGFIDLASGRAAFAEQAWQRAIGHARVGNRRQEECDSLYWQAIALEYGPTHADEAVARCEEIIESAAGQQRVIASTLGSQGALEAMRGRVQHARMLAERAKAIYDELGLSVPEATSSMSFGLIEVLAGDLAKAEAELRKGYEVLTMMDERGFLSTVAAQLADVLCAQGRDGEAKDLIETSAELAAPDDVTSQTMWRTARAKALTHAGSLDEAEIVAREARRRIERTDLLNVHAEALVQLAVVLRLQRRFDEAGAVNAHAVELFERKGNVVSAARVRSKHGAASADPGTPSVSV